MGAERWIVFLMLASLGGGVYIMSYLFDDEAMEGYAKRVADYNVEHDETMLDLALHRSKRRPTVTVEPSKDEPANETEDHPYSENDRVMRARMSDGEDVLGEKEATMGVEGARARRSSGQGINEEHLDEPNQEIDRPGSTSGHASSEEASDGPSQEATAVFNRLTNVESTLFSERTKAVIPSFVDSGSSENNDAQEVHSSDDEAMSLNVFKKWEQSSEESESESSDESTLEDSSVNSSAEADSVNPRVAYMSRQLLESDGDKKLITFNKGIDFILKLMNAMFSLEGEISVPLPALNKTFGKGIMKGTLEASKGSFKNPATLHRTGDVDIVKNGNTVALEVALGLETLEAAYDHYDLKILKIHQNGTIEVSIAENSVKMRLSLTYYPKCKVDVDYLELDKLDGIKINITGLGAFQSMFDMLSKWLLDNFTNDFRKIVNEKLVEKAKKAVARENICEYFPLNLL